MHLSPKLERVALKRGEIIYQADQRIDYVYFPETAVVAMIDTVEDGSTVEVGIIGHEGMVGVNVFLGCLQSAAAPATTLHTSIACHHQSIGRMQPASQRGATPRPLAA